MADLWLALIFVIVRILRFTVTVLRRNGNGGLVRCVALDFTQGEPILDVVQARIGMISSAHSFLALLDIVSMYWFLYCRLSLQWLLDKIVEQVSRSSLTTRII